MTSLHPLTYAKPVAVQVKRPLYPVSPNSDQRSDVVAGPQIKTPPRASQFLPQAINFAQKKSILADGAAMGVFELGGRAPIQDNNRFFVAPLFTTDAKPLSFRSYRQGDPIGGPALHHFDRTLYGSGASDGPVLKAIVGSDLLAKFAPQSTRADIVAI